MASTCIVLSDSTMRLSDVLKQYLKKTLAVETVLNFVFRGKDSTYLIGENGVVKGIMPYSQVNYLILSMGQNDLNFLPSHGDMMVAKLTSQIRENLCKFATIHNHCEIIVLPLCKRKVNVLHYTYHVESKKPVYIKKINSAIDKYSQTLQACECHSKSVFVTKPIQTHVRLTCRDGIHFSPEGKELVLTWAISEYKKSKKKENSCP